MKKRKSKNGLILLAIIVVMVLAFYFYIANRPAKNKNSNAEYTKAQEILLRDISKNYPPTPKEVLRLYAEITQCFYAGGYSEQELDSLIELSYALFDEELKKINSLETYKASVRAEIQDYKKKSYTISAYSTSSSIDIQNATFDRDGSTWTNAYLYLTMRRSTTITRIDEVFVLRKDENGYWRIYGWQLAGENENE